MEIYSVPTLLEHRLHVIPVIPLSQKENSQCLRELYEQFAKEIHGPAISVHNPFSEDIVQLYDILGLRAILPIFDTYISLKGLRMGDYVIRTAHSERFEAESSRMLSDKEDVQFDYKIDFDRDGGMLYAKRIELSYVLHYGYSSGVPTSKKFNLLFYPPQERSNSAEIYDPGTAITIKFDFDGEISEKSKLIPIIYYQLKMKQIKDVNAELLAGNVKELPLVKYLASFFIGKEILPDKRLDYEGTIREVAEVFRSGDISEYMERLEKFCLVFK